MFILPLKLIARAVEEEERAKKRRDTKSSGSPGGKRGRPDTSSPPAGLSEDKGPGR